MKTTLLALSLSLLSMSAFALESSDTPALLSALADDGVQTVAMSDNDMAETRGVGYDFLTKWYYAWKFYGSTSDYRYYNLAYSSSQYHGAPVGNGLNKLGDIFYRTTDSRGTNAPSSSFSVVENRTLNGIWVGSTLLYDPNSVVAYSNWNRPVNTYYW